MIKIAFIDDRNNHPEQKEVIGKILCGEYFTAKPCAVYDNGVLDVVIALSIEGCTRVAFAATIEGEQL